VEKLMNRRLRRALGGAVAASVPLALLSAPGCDKNPDAVVCKTQAVACVAADAAPPRLDGTLPIPVQDCIAAAATEVLVTEQKVGVLAQTSGSDPNVKALGKQMADDFAAAAASLHAAYQGLAINAGVDCAEVHQATAIVEPPLMALQGLSGTAFDQQFIATESTALDQARDFYNSALVANANSGNFKDLLRQERWRFTADGGGAVLKVISCPAPTQADGGSPTCFGIVPEWLAVVALGGGGNPDASGPDGGTPDGAIPEASVADVGVDGD
jgi:hypothetical protein